MELRTVALALVAACGSKKSGPAAATADASVPAPSADAGPTAVARPDAATGPAGEVTVHVEWKDAPAEVRASPGRDPCGGARDPIARVHTLHGVAEAAVWIDDGIAARPGAPARVRLAKCRLEPPVQIAAVGTELRISQLDDGRADVDVRFSDALDQAAETVVARLVLPVVGHTVAMTLDRAGLVEVHSLSADDPAYVVVTPHARAAVTDEAGVAVFSGIPAGAREAFAWRPGKVASQPIEVPDKGEVEVTLSVAR